MKQYDGCEDSRKSLGTCIEAMKSLRRDRIPAGYQQDTCEVSRKSLDTNRIAVKSLGRVWTPAG